MLKYKIPQIVTLTHIILKSSSANSKLNQHNNTCNLQKTKDSRKINPRVFITVPCTPSGIRTLDPLIKSQLLYQLS